MSAAVWWSPVESTQCGQKVHNLCTATEQLAADIEVLAFADSSTCPHRSWLKWLVSGD